MLVHLGEGYFLQTNCIEFIRPDKEDGDITIGLINKDIICIPYNMLDKLIAALDK